MSETYVMRMDMSSSESRMTSIQLAVNNIMKMYKNHNIQFKPNFLSEFIFAIVGIVKKFYIIDDRELIVKDFTHYFEMGLRYWELKEKE